MKTKIVAVIIAAGILMLLNVSIAIAEIATFPYFQGFENDIFPPPDWNHNGWARTTSTYHSGIAAASASIANTGEDTRFILVDNLNFANKVVENVTFWLKISSTDASNTRWIRVLCSTDATDYNNGTWHILRDWENINNWTSWTQVMITRNNSENLAKLDGAIRGLIKIQTKAMSTATSRTVYLDDFEINAKSDWWNSSWQYRRKIMLENHPENFQIKIQLPFYDESIRFTENINGGLLPYWIENHTANEMLVWVRRQENRDNVIYVYYGNPDAKSESNGENVFIFFDNFDYFNTNKWPYVLGSPSVIDGQLEIQNDSGIEGVGTAVVYSPDITLRLRMKGSGQYIHVGFAETNSASRPTIHFYNFTSSSISVYSLPVDGGTYYYTFSPVDATKYNTAEIRWTANVQYVYVEDKQCSLTVTNSFTGRVNMVLYAQQVAYFDFVALRKFAVKDPEVNIGAEEEFASLLIINNISADNLLLDRDIDWNENVITGTKIGVDVEHAEGLIVSKENVWFYFYANTGMVCSKTAEENIKISENKQRFFVTYHTTENILTKDNLGIWNVEVIVIANTGLQQQKLFEAVFIVDDLDVNENIENWPGHKIKVFGNTKPVKGPIGDNSPYTLIQLYLLDTNIGKISLLPADNYSETYLVHSAGYVTAFSATSVLDGKSENKFYSFPNFAPQILPFSVSRSVIDRDQDFAGSGATTATTINIQITDEDNDNITFAWITLWDNINQIRENRIIVLTHSDNMYATSVDFDPVDNLPDSALGMWDVYCYVTDNFTSVERKDNDIFSVIDMTTTISISPTVPYTNWPIQVSGTISGIGYTATVDNIWLIDSGAGTFVLTPTNNWYKEYTVLNAPSSINTITIRLRDFLSEDTVIDGSKSIAYNINENRLYQITLNWENDAKIRTITASDNITMFVYWLENGNMIGYSKKVNAAIENLIINKDLYWIKIVENYYWRGRIPPNYGGVVKFYLPPQKWIEDGTVRQFIFTLSDYTGLYGPPNGQLLIRKAVENQIIIINEDYWDAAWTMPAWLNVNDRYELAVKGLAPLRILGPLDTYPVYERNVLIKAVEPAVHAHIYQHIVMGAWFDNNVLRVRYSDNYGGTTFVRVELYRKGELLVYTESVDDNFLISWNVPITDYTVVFMVDHSTFGTFTHTIPVMYFTTLPPLLPEHSPSIVIGAPVPLLTIGGMIIVLMIGLAFDMMRSHIAAIAMAITAAGLAMFGILPLNQYTIALILFLAVLVLFRRGRER